MIFLMNPGLHSVQENLSLGQSLQFESSQATHVLFINANPGKQFVHVGTLEHIPQF